MLKTLKLILILIFLLSATTHSNAQQQDPKDSAGTLTIHSDIEGESSSVALLLNVRGHSWLDFSSMDKKINWTVGTWHKDIEVEKRKSTEGVNSNLEKNRHPGIYRRINISRDQYAKLVTSIDQHNEWNSIRNCSHFAGTVWNEVTGESLNNWSSDQDHELRELIVGADFGMSRTIPLPSPSGLFTSIFIANQRKFNNDNDALKESYYRSLAKK